MPATCPALIAVAWQPRQAPAPQMLFLNRALAEELGFDVSGRRAAPAPRCSPATPPARRRRAAGAGLTPATSSAVSRRSWATARALVGEVSTATAAPRHRLQGLGPHALRAAATASRRSVRCCARPGRRGDARARHPDHARWRWRPPASRCSARHPCRRRAHARRRQPPARGHLPVLSRRGDLDSLRRSADSTPSRATTDAGRRTRATSPAAQRGAGQARWSRSG